MASGSCSTQQRCSCGAESTRYGEDDALGVGVGDSELGLADGLSLGAGEALSVGDALGVLELAVASGAGVPLLLGDAVAAAVLASDADEAWWPPTFTPSAFSRT